MKIKAAIKVKANFCQLKYKNRGRKVSEVFICLYYTSTDQGVGFLLFRCVIDHGFETQHAGPSPGTVRVMGLDCALPVLLNSYRLPSPPPLYISLILLLVSLPWSPLSFLAYWTWSKPMNSIATHHNEVLNPDLYSTVTICYESIVRECQNNLGIFVTMLV